MYIPSTYKCTTFNTEWVFSFFFRYTPYDVFSQWTNSSSFFINWELIQWSLASFNVIFLSLVVATVLVRFSWIFSMVSSLFSGKTYFRALLASSLIGKELDRGIGFFWLTRWLWVVVLFTFCCLLPPNLLYVFDHSCELSWWELKSWFANRI